MKKKLGMALASMTLASGAIFGTDAGSYFSTALHEVRKVVVGSVPIDLEIGRARNLIGELGSVIDSHRLAVAEEEVRVEKLSHEADAQQKWLEREQVSIVKLRQIAASGLPHTVQGRTYSPAEVKADLEARFARYRTGEDTRDKLRETITARNRGLTAARQKIEAMQRAQRRLEVDVENLVARKQMVEVAQAESGLHLDDSHLARTEKALDAISARVSVAERLVALRGPQPGEIPVGDDAEADVFAQIEKHFGLEEAPTPPVASDEAEAPPAVSVVASQGSPLVSKFNELLEKTVTQLFEGAVDRQ